MNYESKNGDAIDVLSLPGICYCLVNLLYLFILSGPTTAKNQKAS